MAAPVAEIEIDAELVRALLQEQHPDLAALRIERIACGWDNEIFRLGEDLTVRLPRRLASAELIRAEQRWLPELAVGLPLPIPSPLRVGVPSAVVGYPWHWSVAPWFRGADAEHRPPDDLHEAARDLGRFLAAFHRPAPPDAPTNPYRGIPLAEREGILRTGLRKLGGSVDPAPVERCWHALVDTAPWPGPPLWLHGDVHPLNLLVHDGRLSAAIDFGDLCAGDPASDLAVAWMLLPPTAHPVFRDTAGGDEPVDDDTWRRARGWAVALGVAMSNGDGRVAAIGRRTLHAALAGEP